MTQEHWKSVERAAWIATIISVLLAVVIYAFPPKPDDRPPGSTDTPASGKVAPSVAGTAVPTAASVVPAAAVEQARQSDITESLPPKHSFDEDTRRVRYAFGDLVDGTGKSTRLTGTPDGSTVKREQTALELADGELKLDFWMVEVAGSAPWFPTSDNTRTTERIAYNCSAKLMALRPPVLRFGKVDLICAADRECWKCVRTTSFNESVTETIEFSRQDWRLDPNKDRGQDAVDALLRLRSPQTSYK